MEAPLAVVERLCRLTNEHDLDGIVGCFSEDYRNETPLHEERGFVGSEQVRRNWEQILGAVADVHTEILGSAVDGDVVWTEWEHRGTRPDGTPHLMRGVIIFRIAGEKVASARFYLEPVQPGARSIDEAVRAQVAPQAR
jgi:ketosteroid isomerase-like protein